jgi:uncharacterized protein YjbI with pentapeptide repeats
MGRMTDSYGGGLVGALTSHPATQIAQFLFGDVLSAVGLAQRSVSALHNWRQQRASLGDAAAAMDELLAGIPARFDEAIPPAARRQVLLILSAFAEAWWRCQFYGFCRADIKASSARERFANLLAERWSAALAPDAPDLSAQAYFIRRLTDDPLRTPYYEALWQAFTDASWEPPLLLRGRRRTFEHFFRLAYGTALASHEGEEVRRYLEGLEQQQADNVRQRLVEDIAGWGARHVFGNVTHHEQLPDLPLAEMYVEPMATTTVQISGRTAQIGPKPVIALLRQLLGGQRIVVVRAPMGFGKSLTARRIALELAQEYLDTSNQASTCAFPIFIRCADDLETDLVGELDRVVRRALHRQARDHLGLTLAEADPACAPPDVKRRALYILDGLDEVLLSAESLRRLFEHLERRTSEAQRCLIFSRPQVLPHETIQKYRIPVVDLESLSVGGSESQAEEWLGRWNYLVRHPQNKSFISLEAVNARGLGELAATPILLFMIAITWDKFQEGAVQRVALYEAFLQQLAHGKHKMDVGAEHRQIREAARQLHERLILKRFIPQEAKPHEAMLWLMSRVAWEAHCLEQREEALHKRHIEQLVLEELDIKHERALAHSISGGVFLALQADPSNEDHALLFGHKSFREYLVARYWSSQLRRIIETRAEKRKELTNTLRKGRLLQRADRSIDFLIEILDTSPDESPREGRLPGFTDEERHKIIDWASFEFNDESLDSTGDEKNFAKDRRSALREASLAIGSLVKNGGIEVEGPDKFRSLLAWFWLTETRLIVRGSRLRHKGARLDTADLDDSWLDGADLAGASLTRASLFMSHLDGVCLDGATLVRANLCGASLENASLDSATLDGARLSDARLNGASLKYASLDSARLENASLNGARLVGAHLVGARLNDARLNGASLENASLHSAILDGASLENARLDGARLDGARLENTSLKNASLNDACLDGANLTNANLISTHMRNVKMIGARLIGARLARADLRDAHLAGAIFSEDNSYRATCTTSTLWPTGFDWEAAGVFLVEEQPDITE